MAISLSEHFNYKKLIKFTLPTIAMMIFTSIYGVVDGYFVSNYVGEDAFTSIREETNRSRETVCLTLRTRIWRICRKRNIRFDKTRKAAFTGCLSF